MGSNQKDSVSKRLQLALKATEIRLKRAKADRDGLVQAWGEGTFGVCVSPRNVNRVLRILRLLAEQLLAQGVSLKPADGSPNFLEGRAARWSSSVVIDGCRISFRIREAWKLVPYEWTEDDHRSFNRSGYTPYQKTSRKLTGELCFVIDGYYNAKTLWRDGKRRGPLERQLPSIVDGLTAVAEERKESEARRRERELEHRAWAEKEREAARVREEKRRRFELLLQEANAWRQVQDICDFVLALRAAAGEELDPEVADRVDRWAGEAIDFAREMDPVPQLLCELAQPEA